MVQLLSTIFFSAALLSALGVIAAMIADNLVDVRRALGLEPAAVPRPSRVRVRHTVVRHMGRSHDAMAQQAPRATPLRAAA